MKWYAVVIIVLLGFLVIAVWSCMNLKEKADKPGDSTLFKQSRSVVSGYILERDELRARLKESDSARATLRAYGIQADRLYRNQIKDLKRQLKAVNTARATVPELDSIHLAMFGPAPDDSLHTIPLDYSRKLTGDALRLPIEQRMATTAMARLDSAESHYGRMEDSYKVDIRDLKQAVESGSQAIDSLGMIAGKMQGVIDTQDRKFRRKRRVERVVEGLAMAGVIILVIL